MKRKNMFAKSCSAALCVAMLCPALTVPAAGAENEEDFSELLQTKFENPDMTERPSARWWMAEGLHSDETIRESIRELYDYGFGSVEFVTLDESEHLDNETYAWGSEAWVHDTQVVVEECTKLGMGVSLTSGTHWSTSNLVSINPDEEAASQELGYQTVDVAVGQEYNGTVPKPALTEFATIMRLEKIIAAKVTSFSEEEELTGLDADSLKDVTELAVEGENGEWNISYTAPTDGDYKLFAFWQYGTSENYKPAISNSYTINYYSKEGANALIDYWENTVLTPELREVIKENGHVSMFMDSLELNPKGENNTGNLWSVDYLEQFEKRRGYDVSLYLPILIMSNYRFNQPRVYPFVLEGKEDICEKVRNDLYQTNTELYRENCLDIIKEWLNGFGMTLRAQNSYGKELEISTPVKSIDFVETESLAYATELDSFRGQSGAAHLYDKVYSSETNAIMYGNYKYSSDYLMQAMYTQFASGIQKTVTHGYSSEYGPEENTVWPGFEGMMPMFSERYNKRQPNSIDYPQLWGNHVARLQSVLMQGAARMDLGILRSDYVYCKTRHRAFPREDHQGNNYLRQHKGYYWEDTTLQDAGYTYDYFSPMILQDTDITCENGLVQADSVGYQALLLYQEELPYESAEVLYQWASDGLPVVIVEGSTTEDIFDGKIKTNESAAITTGFLDGKDEELAQLMKEIKALDTVKTVETEAEAYGALQELGVRPRAEFTEANQNLLTVMREAEDASYLYVYNYMYEDEQSFKGQISVEGIHTPYVYNTWNNEAEHLGEYTCEDGRTILNVDIEPGEVVVFALDSSNEPEVTIVAAENVEKAVVEDEGRVLYVPESGNVALTYSDGSTASMEIAVPDDIVLGDWNLVVESWEPGEKISRSEDRGLGYVSKEVTYTTDKRSIDVGQTALIPWKDMEAVGKEVSGVGYYTNTFVTPEDWAEENGLMFEAESFSGGTATLFVNGTQVPLNMDNGRADISDYVQIGENSIEVRVTSSLRNRMLQIGYEGWSDFVPEPAEYGLQGEVILNAYTRVAAE